MKFKLQRKEDVWQAIRRRGKEIASKLKDNEIFQSPEFANYATRLADFILRKHKLYSLEIVYDTAPDAPIGYTDGKKIFLNTGNRIAAKPKLLERRFKVNMGVLFHECAHKLFLDFKTFHKIIDTLCSGELYGDFSEDLPAEYETALSEIKEVMNSPYRMSLVSLFKSQSNSIDDGHDERTMKQCFPGFIADCITVCGEDMLSSWPTLEKMISDRCTEYEIYDLLILQYAKHGHYKTGKGTSEEEAYLAKMQEIEPIIDEALLEHNYASRWNCVNRIMLFLWPTIRDHFPKNPQNQQSDPSSQSGSGSSSGGSSGNGSGGQGSQSGNPGSSGSASQPQGQSANGNSTSANPNHGENGDETEEPGSDGSNPPPPSPEEVEAAMNAMIQQLQQSRHVAPAPVNEDGEAIDPSQINSSTAPNTSADGMAQIMQSLSESKAAKQIQQELDKAQMEAIRNMNLPLIHKHVPVRIIRHNPQDEVKYKKISEEIAPVVRNLTKQMLDLFREYNEECVQHHKRFGPMIEATEAYRPDRAFFAKKKLPEDLPDMALCILIDQSPSMYGKKLKTGIKTAILLEQFANNVGIPLMIAGHHASQQGVQLQIYTDYISAMRERDKYTLAGISTGGWGNRDGLPIRLCCELLEQRTEKVKLMVIISDGSPADDNYRGEEARKDISDTVNQFRRKGLTIYGAAIDDDRDIIQEIYGKGFLSIDNLDLLPKTLVRLVRQNII